MSGLVSPDGQLEFLLQGADIGERELFGAQPEAQIKRGKPEHCCRGGRMTLQAAKLPYGNWALSRCSNTVSSHKEGTGG